MVGIRKMDNCRGGLAGSTQRLAVIFAQNIDLFSMKDFRKLNVWKKAHRLTLAVYEATRDFPKSELYGLTSQIRRAFNQEANG